MELLEYEYNKDFFIYDSDLIEKMYNVRFAGIPASFFLLDLRKTNTQCHQNARYLTYIIDGSKKITGILPEIKGKDKTHSWVETDKYVYDTTMGIKFRKEVYYDLKNIDKSTIRIDPDYELLEKIERAINIKENLKEVYYAFIKDMEDSMDDLIYRSFLLNHIERFKKEKDLNNAILDENIVNEYLNELNNLYKKADKLIKNANEEEKKKKTI